MTVFINIIALLLVITCTHLINVITEKKKEIQSLNRMQKIDREFISKLDMQIKEILYYHENEHIKKTNHLKLIRYDKVNKRW